MKLIYKEKPSEFMGRGQTKVISSWEKHFCCKDMEEHWAEDQIGLDESGIFVDKQANVTLCFKETYEDEVERNYVPIQFCPFCGEKIVKEDV